MRTIRGLVAATLVAATAAACASPYDYRYSAYNSGYYYRTSSYYPSGYYYPASYYRPRAYFVAYAP
ncbi:MAG: hypothetical protein AB7F22_24390 [Reyranella sp.]|uniref:hypothetical protein n=1 Tax=Reyranella sp. TaxID=1929291 RepID=UPI003D0FBEEC